MKGGIRPLSISANGSWDKATADLNKHHLRKGNEFGPREHEKGVYGPDIFSLNKGLFSP